MSVNQDSSANSNSSYLNHDIDTDRCQICNGTKITYLSKPCYFCNGTGLRNHFTDSFIKNHICLCASTDRRTCPVCRRRCHHDTTLNPRILISK
jgi:RecJ-like exonuclease